MERVLFAMGQVQGSSRLLIMRIKSSVAFAVVTGLVLLAAAAAAQDLGPHFRKINDGIYVQSAREVNSTSSIVLTEEGPVIIDTGQTPADTREVMDAVKKLTPLPVRFVINTEVHPDHTTGNFVFSPPAVVINHEGAAEAMRQAADPNRIGTLRSQSTEMRDALEGYRLVTPHFEYHDKATLHVGERTFELLHLKNLHSEADTAVWLPNERVLFASSVAIPDSINNLRPFVAIPEMLTTIKMLKSLNPEVVVPGHGSFGTTKIFDDSERYYGLLLEPVGAMVRAGKSLDPLKQELRMPED